MKLKPIISAILSFLGFSASLLIAGFSLIELLVVVAIIGILAAIGTVGYNQYVNSARDAALLAIANQVSTALQTCDSTKTCTQYIKNGEPLTVWDVIGGDNTGTDGLLSTSRNPWDNSPWKAAVQKDPNDNFSFGFGIVGVVGNSLPSTTACVGAGQLYLNTYNNQNITDNNFIQIVACTSAYPNGDPNSPAGFDIINTPLDISP